MQRQYVHAQDERALAVPASDRKREKERKKDIYIYEIICEGL